MMKKAGTILSILFIFTISSILSVNVYADSFDDYIDGVKATISGYGTSEDTEIKQDNTFIRNDISYSINSNKYIQLKQSSIHDIGGGYVNIKASTKTNETVDILSLTVFLERWSNNSWSTVKSWNTNNYNSNTIDFITVHSVNSGDRYRVRAVHTAHKGTVSESDQTVTSYITIQ